MRLRTFGQISRAARAFVERSAERKWEVGTTFMLGGANFGIGTNS
ncbi:MAG: hypothetical protein ACK4YL_08940 [Microcystis sp.]|nr:MULTISPECIES: hypothetical protein [unclassified Microcystis]MCZ8272202.1 hypothetical protein [Microcystis sp. LE19-4.1E]MDJ0551818.1 hypothetical protein [Microcystis sp. M49637_WE12]MDJ0561492.1 hypothetical protein [Microcystis sp. M53599_WE4]MCZ8065633.1 hypothetical protein [Microcystis sp. LE17-20D]MDJ0584240.1 hypothetical protein [Microcystis sp. M49636_WE2]